MKNLNHTFKESKPGNLFFANPFLLRLNLFLPLSLLAILGVLIGSVLMLVTNLFQRDSLLPLFFSEIPSPDKGFPIYFSTFLLNMLIFLTLAFLSGLTVFGIVAVSMLALLKGITVGLGVSYFLLTYGIVGLGKSALLYAPVAAASLILFLLFEVRALVFSESLRKTGFSSDKENLSFYKYFKSYLCFLCPAVIISALGGGFAFLCSSVLSLL